MVRSRIARGISASVVTSLVGAFTVVAAFVSPAAAAGSVGNTTATWYSHHAYGDGYGSGVAEKATGFTHAVTPTSGPTGKPGWTLAGTTANGSATAKATNTSNTLPATATPWVFLKQTASNAATLVTNGLTTTGTYKYKIAAYSGCTSGKPYATCTTKVTTATATITDKYITLTAAAVTWAVHVPYGTGSPAPAAKTIKDKTEAAASAPTPARTVTPTSGPTGEPGWTFTGLNANGISVAKPTNSTNTLPSTATKPWIFAHQTAKNEITVETSGLTTTGSYTFTVHAYSDCINGHPYTTCATKASNTLTITAQMVVITSAASYERYTADEHQADTANFTVVAVGNTSSVLSTLAESGTIPSGVTGFTAGLCTSLTVNAYTVKCALRGTYAAGTSGHTPPIDGATAHATAVTFSAENATHTKLVTQAFTFNVLPPAICVVKPDTTGKLVHGYTAYAHTATAAYEPTLVQTVTAGGKLYTGCSALDATGGISLTIDASPLSDIWSDPAPNTTPEDDYDTGSAGTSALKWTTPTATGPPLTGPTATSTIAATFKSTDKNTTCPPKPAVIDIGGVFCYVSDETSGAGPTYSTFFLEYKGHVPAPNTPTLKLTSGSVKEGGTLSVSDTVTACPASISAVTFTKSYRCWWGNPTTTKPITATDITIGSGPDAVHPTSSTVSISKAEYFFTSKTTSKKSHLTPEHISGSFTLPDNAPLGVGVPVTITEPVNPSTSLHTRMGVGFLASTVTGSSSVSITTGVAITSTSSAAFVQGSPGSFTVRTGGEPTPSLSETGTLPTHVVFHATTPVAGEATISGKPIIGTAGQYPIKIKASSTVDTVTQTATQTFTLSVSASTVTSISPTYGPVGTKVHITGTNFDTVTAVKFGTATATFTPTYTSASITATSPAGTGTVPVTVTSAAGTTALSTVDKYTYSPVVTSVSPTAGPLGGGTTVTVRGANFTTVSSVKFGGSTAISFHRTSSTKLTAKDPAAGAGTVAVSVTTAHGGTGSLASAFVYVPAPTVTKVTPSKGVTAGGTTVTITGTNFKGTGFTVSRVKFGATVGTVVSVTSPNKLTVKDPAGSGTVAVSVATPGGTGTEPSAFTYEPSPTVTKVTPVKGPIVGGTTVTVTGSTFVTVTSVKFGSTAGTTVHVTSPTKLTVKDPAGGGTVAVTVVTAFGSGTKAAAFTYVPPPTITSLSRTSGPSSGGTQVTVTGANFTTVSAVEFGTTAAESFTVRSSTQLVATSPAHTAGTVKISVTAVGGSGTSAASYKYLLQVPTVIAVSPASGPPSGGTVVTVSGSALTGATAVYFGAKTGTTITVLSGTDLTVKSPSGTSGTAVAVRVVTPGGESATSGVLFTYGPTITSLSRTSGPPTGGTKVTITGRGFSTATHVKFGTTTAETFTVKSSTQITATSPAHAAGQVRVSVTTPSGTTPSTSADLYTYT